MQEQVKANDLYNQGRDWRWDGVGPRPIPVPQFPCYGIALPSKHTSPPWQLWWSDGDETHLPGWYCWVCITGHGEKKWSLYDELEERRP